MVEYLDNGWHPLTEPYTGLKATRVLAGDASKRDVKRALRRAAAATGETCPVDVQWSGSERWLRRQFRRAGLVYCGIENGVFIGFRDED